MSKLIVTLILLSICGVLIWSLDGSREWYDTDERDEWDEEDDDGKG